MVAVTRTQTVLQEDASMEHVLIPMAKFAMAKNAQAMVNVLQDVAI